MATLLELAELSSAAYGTASAIAWLKANGWVPLPGADGATSNPSHNYFGVAYQNVNTQEIVISNRGTQPSSFKDLYSDVLLATGTVPPAVSDAIAFATQVAKDFPGVPLTVTGHSLGGYEAAAVEANLVDRGIDPSATAVTFEAPGLPAQAFHGAAGSYNVLNIYNQGDAIHLAGGTVLGLSASLPAGQSLTSEFSDAAAGFAAGAFFGGLGGLILGGAILSKDLLKSHALALSVDYLNNTPSVGGETPSQFIGADQGFTPSVLLTSPVRGSLALSNGAGDVFTLQLQSNGQMTNSVAFGSDGAITPASNVSALMSELIADGQATVFENESLQAIQALINSASSYATIGPASGTGSNSVVLGATQTGQSSGLPAQVFLGDATPDGRVDFTAPSGSQLVSELIVASAATRSVWLDGNNTYAQLTGGAPVAGTPKVWTSNGLTYTFAGSPNNSLGTLTITGAPLGSNASNAITIDNFNLSAAHTAAGFMGIVLPEEDFFNAAANAGVDPPAPNFVEGTNQSYTLSVDAPSTTAQTFNVTLAGATPSDFEVSVGNAIEQIGANGTFNVTLVAGETNVSFGLVDTTADNGSSDIASGANLTLSASIVNPDTLVGGNISTTPLTFNYIPQAPDNAPAPQPLNTIAGTLSGGTMVYAGDGGDDFMTGTGTSNLFNAQNSGNDSLVGGTGTNTINGSNGNSVIVLNGTSNTVFLGTGYNTISGSTGNDIIGGGTGDENISGNGGADLIVLGNGNSQIYAGAQTSLATAIAATSGGTASGVKGDLIAVGDGNNTVIGGNGNDLINVGGGHDVIVMGPGNDTFLGGTETTQAVVGWSTTITPPGSGHGYILTENGVAFYVENFANPYPQPNNNPNVGPANDTIFGGKGNEFLLLGNGNNYVESGNGNDTVLGGMGNDTIILGSGSDTVRGGGGTTYIAGGSGHDSITGGDGDNTIIGGSGNSTILAAGGPDGTTNFTGANLEQNYVFGGSGNDVIQGSAGNDTLIAGSGNTTITGVTGNENITGGSGIDLLFGGTGNNTITAGGAGRDTLFAIGSSTSTSILYGGTGTDFIEGGSGTNTLYAGDGGIAGGATTVLASQTDATATTTIYGGLGVDLLGGGAGSAVIYGGEGGTSTAVTSIQAGSGNTTVFGGLGTDLIIGGSGTDVLYAGDGGTASAPTSVSSGTGIETLFGGAGASRMQDIQSGLDLLVSGTANDTMIGIGSDTLVAGSGNDGLQVNSGSVDFQFNEGFGNDTVIANGGTANILLGSGILATDFSGSIVADLSGNLLLSGDGGSILLSGALTGALSGASNVGGVSIALPTFLTDVLGGDQTVTNSSGGSDIVSLGTAESVALTQANGLISSWGANASLSGTSGSIYSAGASAIIISGGVDRINAVGANAAVIGGVSDQVTLSGANSLAVIGNGTFITVNGAQDTVTAASGVNSTITVNDASAVIQVAAGTGTTTVNSTVSFTAPTNVSILTLIGSSNITATANAGADSLTAGAGNDTLVAGAGIDTLKGGTGSTTFVVNNANDVVQGGSGSNIVLSSINYTLASGINTLILSGTAALTGTANSANDTLTSNSGVDTLIGGAGNDTFILNNPLDVVQDTAGVATIIYSGSATSFTLPANFNTLTLTGTTAIQATGNAGNDSITGNSGADTLSAGNGTDTLVSGLGTAVQSLVGGTGNDLFVVNSAGDIVTVGAIHGTDTIRSSVSYTASPNVADLTLMGTSALVGTGNALANILTANSGADTLVAGSGTATLVGGSGNDTFVVNSATDLVNDTSTAATNTLNSSVNYTLPTDVNNLVFTGTTALIGTANSANDTLTSNAGADTLVGSTGNETFVVTNGGVVVQDSSTTASNAIIASASYTLPTNVDSLSFTGTAALQGTGNSGNDILTANTGADTLVAGSGSDTLIAGAGATADSLVGGTGSDLFILGHAADVVSVGATHGADTIQSSLSYTLPANVNALVFTGSADLTGVAISGNNSLIGNGGNDILNAGSGNDTLIAGTGLATLIGGSGADTFVINSASDVLQSVSTASNTVVSSVSYTMATNIASLILQGSGNLLGLGNTIANSITANSGSDTLVAGSGAANLVGGLGADLFVINSAADTVSEPQFALKGAIDTIQSSVSYTLPTTVDILLLSGTANLTAQANSSADLLIGNAGNDTLVGGVGNDTLSAGAGAAVLIGGSGNNTFIINNTSDTVQETTAGHNNAVLSSVTYSLPTNVNILILTGSGNLTATANSANDSIRGNSGADVLIAGGGVDTLAAGSGLATLVGGTGADTFIVNNASDVIQSASASSENVVLSSVTYVLPTNVGQLILTGVANIEGTGNAAPDTLTAGAGQDTLVAGSGAATLIGGGGNDTFVINSASDLVQDGVTSTANTIQSSVNDTLVSNVNTLVFTGTAALTGTANSANDTLTSNTGADTLVGGTGNDTFVINNSADVIQDASTTAVNVAQSAVNYSLGANINTLLLTGTAALVGIANGGADTLISNTGADTLVGGTGNDTFVVNSSDVVVQGNSATSNLIESSVSYTLPSNVDALTLIGTAAISATGNATADVIQAGSGTDTLFAGSGVATLIGGAGPDTFVVNSVSDVVQDSTFVAGNAVLSSVSYSLSTHVNVLTLTGAAALVGTANSAGDTLVSNSGVDTLVGGVGADLFIVNNSADVIVGASAADTIESSVNFSVPAGATNLILIGSANLVATGNTSADTLTAGAGSDTLVAGTGIAKLVGGTGNGTFVVNNASDIVQIVSATASNLVLSSVGYSLPANADVLVLTGSGNLTAFGNTDAANSITANTGNDFLVGLAFSNTLTGGSGSDTIDAGPFLNLIYAGNGGTTLQPTSVAGNAAGTSVQTQSTIYGGTGIDKLQGGPGSDLIVGQSGATTLISGTGFDTLMGAAGNDLLDQQSGNALLVAGSGAETLQGVGLDVLQAGTGNDVLGSLSTSSSLEYEFGPGFGTDTVNPGASLGANLFFNGITASAVSISEAVVTTSGNPTDVALVLNDGASSIQITGGLAPGSLSTVQFAGSPSQTLAQYIEAHGPGTLNVGTGSSQSLLSTSDGQSVTPLATDEYIWAFGNNDVVSNSFQALPVFVYGNNSTVNASSSWIGGNDDVITGARATLTGGNDTVISSTNENGNFLVEQASTTFQAAVLSNDSITSYVSYTLPINVARLTLDSLHASLTGFGNTSGGILVAAGNFDTLVGGSGVDTLVSQGSNDVLIGGVGRETFLLTNNALVELGSGTASLNTIQTAQSYTLGGAANTLIETGSFATGVANSANDSLIASGAADTLVAGSGTDTLAASATSAVTLVGGTGNDTFIVNQTSDVVTDSASTTSNTLMSSVSYSLPTNVNTLILSGAAAIVGTANSANDTLSAGVGADTLAFNAGYGQDLLIPGSGDVIQFGTGITESSLAFSALLGSGAAPSLVIAGDGGSVTVQGGLVPGVVNAVKFSDGSSFTVGQLVAPTGRTTITGTNGNLVISNVPADSLIGGSGSDTLIGYGNSDTLAAGTGGALIYAGGGGDLVSGSAAADTLDAIGASDTLVGGSGHETFMVNAASTVVQANAAGTNSLLSSISYSMPANVTTLVLIGTSALQATGNSSSDVISGNTGFDTLTAGTGVATLIGGSLADTFVINSTSDVVQPVASSADTIDSFIANYTLPANVNNLLVGSGDAGTANPGNDYIQGSGHGTLTGGSGADTLSGINLDLVRAGSGPSLLLGNSSTLVSGTGIDTLESSGSDTLVINNSSDVIVSLFPDNQSPTDTLDTTVNYTLAASAYPPPNFGGGVIWNLQGTANLLATDLANIAVLFTPNAGSDTMVGGPDSNTFFVTGTAVQTEIGGSGINNFFVTNSADVVSAPLGSNDTLNSSISYTLPANINSLLLENPGLIGAANSGNDTLMGSQQGHDTLFAGSGNDVLTSQGNGMLIAGSGNDALTSVGAAGGDTLVAGTGNDTLTANVGGVFLFNTGFGSALVSGAHSVGEPGTTIEFGTGISPANLGVSATLDPQGLGTLKITDGSSSITLDGVLDSYGFEFGTGAAVNLSQFLSEVPATTSSVAGGLGNESVEGASAVALAAGSSSDTIYAAGANDTVLAGTGADVLVALGSADSIVGGGSGDFLDFLQALGANDTLVAGASIATMQGRAAGTTTYVVNNSGDVIQGGAINDTIYSSVDYTNAAGTLVLTGTAALTATAGGSDTLVSNSGVDTLIGSDSDFFEDGVSVFVVNNSLDVLEPSNSALGEDTVVSSVSFTLPSEFASLILTGTAALTGTANADNDAELIVGNSGNDTLVAGIGTDTLISGTGAAVDSLVGGSGNDTFVVNNAADIIQDTSATAINVLQTTVNYTLPVNVNRLVLTGSGNLSGTGNSANDSLVGGSGLDTLTAGSGTDTLVAGNGLTTLIGGTGNDVFVVNNAADVIQDSSATTNSVQSSASFSLVTNVNSLTLTGTFALTGTANGATDTLTSNTGVDTLVGGTGNDTFVINNSSDVIQDTSTTATNLAKAAVSYSLAANVNTLTLTGSAALVGTANSGNDSLTGNSGADTLIGGTGVDTLTAGAGVNTLIGGTGNTIFVVNNASDVVQDTSSSANNTLRSSVTYVLPTNVNALVLTGTSALKGTANSGNDTLTSNTGLDTLVGGAGNDTFVVSNSGDIVQDTSSTSTNTILSTVAFTLPTNVNTLTFTGNTALHGTGNAGNDSMTANSGADTLSAGNGTDTLVSGTTGADSLVAGTGNDLFIVNFAGDIVTVGSTHGTDTIQSSVTYTAAPNVANLILTGTAALTGTGSSTAITIGANSGADTLAAGSGVATLVGGPGNDTFVVNNVSDVVQDTSTTATNTLLSSVSYTLPTDVNRLILTGTAALMGTANSANDTLTANTGADTLVSGSAVDSLVGGTGADLFVINNGADIVTVGSTHGVDTIQSSVSYTASANVANLTLIGTAAIAGTGNSLAGTLSANNANDTLIAGSGIDTLVGGTGTDLFIVNSASDVVTLGTSGTSDTIQSSASYTLPTNVQYLTLNGTSALTGTGNSLTDLIVGNSGADTLVGGTGIAVLEGGRTAGSDQIKALSNQAALIGGAAASTLTGGAFKDFYAAGKVSDSITTGATANVVAVNKGDGATTLQPTTSATNVLSLGAGIDTESLFFTKTGNNLILTDGVSGDSITFTNWYLGATDQNYTTLQVVEIASANYNAAGSDGLRNKALEAFNFTALVAAYNAAGSPANWALSTAMPTTQLTTTSTADYGGDLAYYFGLNGNLTGMDLSAAQSTLTNVSFGTAAQTIDAFSGISGGGGLHLAVAPTPPRLIAPILGPKLPDESLARGVSPQVGIQLRPTGDSPTSAVATSIELHEPGLNLNAAEFATAIGAALSTTASAPVESTLRLPTQTDLQVDPSRLIAGGGSPQMRLGLAPAVSTIQIPAMSQATVASQMPEAAEAGVGSGDYVAPSIAATLATTDFPRPQMLDEDDFLRTITPRIPSVTLMSTSPATSNFEAPPMSAAMGVTTVTENPGTTQAQSATDSVESQAGEAALNTIYTSIQGVVAAGRSPNVLGNDLSTSAELPDASEKPNIAAPRIGGMVTPVKVADINSILATAETAFMVNPQPNISWSQGLFKNLVSPVNVAWLTMHDSLDQSGATTGGSELTTEQGTGANDALVAGSPIGSMHRLPDELQMHSQQFRQRVV